MKLPTPPGPFTWIGWAVAAAGVLAAVLVLVWLLGAPGREAATAAKAKADGVVAGAQTKAATKAAEINDEAQKRAAESEELTRENERAIRASCPGPDCNSAALRGLCRRAAYRCSDDCLRLLGRPDPACPR